MNPLLEMDHLQVTYSTKNHSVFAVQDFSLTLHKGEVLGIVGESGSGKSSIFTALFKLLPESVCKTQFEKIQFLGKDLSSLSPYEFRSLLGRNIGWIPQDPFLALHPSIKIKKQLIETLTYHKILPKKEAIERVTNLLKQTGLNYTDAILNSYPHELSGGEIQRVLLTMALSAHPMLLIADEPTTALDVLKQKDLLKLFVKMKEKYSVTMIIISHDLGFLSKICERLIVMYAGKIVEEQPSSSFFSSPLHPYSEKLLKASLSQKEAKRPFAPSCKKATQTPQMNKLLEVKNLSQAYQKKKKVFFALEPISFSIFSGETLAVVGESGSGKSTLAKCLLHLQKPTSGKVFFQGIDFFDASDKQRKALRKEMQIIFQDPFSSLSPRMKILDILQEPFKVHKIAYSSSQIFDLLSLVSLPKSSLEKYPHEFSGGQRQRIAIAKALALNPSFLVCDEALSSLDTSIQAQILELFLFLKKEKKLTYLFISHNLAQVSYLADRILVLKKGKQIELGTKEAIFSHPKETYTKELLEAAKTFELSYFEEKEAKGLGKENTIFSSAKVTSSTV